VALSVVLVSHQIRANCTIWLPSKEIACPVQIVKNGPAHFFRGVVSVGVVLVIGIYYIE
jgi:hypothetical protein